MPDENLESVEAALSVPGRGMGEAQKSAPVQQVQQTPQPAPTGQAAQMPAMKEAMARVKATLAGLNTGTLRFGGTQKGSFGGSSLSDLYKSLSSPSAPGAPQPQPATPPAVQPTAPQQPVVKMVAPAGGGKQLASYDHNGMSVLLGDDIDVNDAAAVQKRMDETNDLIDMMNSAYDEEV